MTEGDIKTVDDLKKEADDGKIEKIDIIKTDTSKFTPEQTAAHLSELRDENAKRRISEKKTKEESDKLTLKLADVSKSETELKATVAAFEKDKKDAELADATALEKANSELGDLKKTIKDAEKAQKKSDADLAKANLQVNDKEREAQVDRLVSVTGKNFSSTYERDGFILELLKRNSDSEFELNLEETVLRVNEFFKQKKIKPEDTPGAGPGERTVDATLSSELGALMGKDHLSSEEQLRLAEISGLLSEAAKPQ